MKKFSAADVWIFIYIGGLSVAVLGQFTAIPHAGRFLAYHAVAAAFVAILASANAHFGGRFWNLLHVWYPLYLLPAAFRELHYLIPVLHPHGQEFDRALLQLDTALLGDVRARVEILSHPVVIDALHVCYWTYILFPVLLGLVLGARGRWDDFREGLSVMVLAWLTSYTIYIIVPAYGPYTIDAVSPPGLRDNAFAQFMHRTLLEWEWRIADAFPSGHVLIVTLSLWAMRRRARGLFWIMLLPGIVLALATIVLRYHYAVDLLASWMIAPFAIWAGLRLHRRVSAGGPPA